MNPTPIQPLPDFLLLPLVEAALREDIRSGDITTTALIPPGTTCRAEMVCREAGVIAGLALARLAFSSLDPAAKVELHTVGGASVRAGETVLIVEGSAGAILSAERVALNFVQHLSGIATFTRQFVDAVAGTGARIVEIRKTTPGLRLVQKHAVLCGGGHNHRYALDDMVLIKDNHIALCGGVAPAIQRARAAVGHSLKIEVECDTLEQVHEAAEACADIILLDNMTPAQLREAVSIIDGRSITEASGGVNLDTVRAIAESGVDVISVGALTHSVKALDVGLDVILS